MRGLTGLKKSKDVGINLQSFPVVGSYLIQSMGLTQKSQPLQYGPKLLVVHASAVEVFLSSEHVSQG